MLNVGLFFGGSYEIFCGILIMLSRLCVISLLFVSLKCVKDVIEFKNVLGVWCCVDVMS